jgi:aldose 1-epimerase
VSAHAVEREERSGVEIVRLSAPGRASAEIVPAWGGSCVAFYVEATSVLEEASFEEIAKKPTSYGIPILFPFPNRIRDRRFTFEGKELRVDVAQHGLVRDKPWTVVASDASDGDGAWVRVALEAREFSSTILGQFPFPFRIEVTYRLRASALELVAVAKNTGDATMPAGFGIHPYFRAPERGTVCVPAAARWELADHLPTGRVLPVDDGFDLRKPRAIAGLALDDVYTSVVARGDGRARATIDDPTLRRRSAIEFDPRSLPECVVYTPPAPRRAICVEPQSCPTDAFNLAARGVDAHVVRLAPGEESRWSILIRSEPMG